MSQLEETFEVSGAISLRRHSIVIPASAAFNLAPVTGSPAPCRPHPLGRTRRLSRLEEAAVNAQNSVDLSTGGARKPPRAVGTSHFLPAGWINAAISGTTPRPDDRVSCGRPQLGLQWSNQTATSGVMQEEVQMVDQHLLKEVMLMEALSEVHLAHEILMMEAGQKRGRNNVESGAVWTCILQVR